MAYEVCFLGSLFLLPIRQYALMKTNWISASTIKRNLQEVPFWHDQSLLLFTFHTKFHSNHKWNIILTCPVLNQQYSRSILISLAINSVVLVLTIEFTQWHCPHKKKKKKKKKKARGLAMDCVLDHSFFIHIASPILSIKYSAGRPAHTWLKGSLHNCGL